MSYIVRVTVVLYSPSVGLFDVWYYMDMDIENAPYWKGFVNTLHYNYLGYLRKYLQNHQDNDSLSHHVFFNIVVAIRVMLRLKVDVQEVQRHVDMLYAKTQNEDQRIWLTFLFQDDKLIKLI